MIVWKIIILNLLYSISCYGSSLDLLNFFVPHKDESPREIIKGLVVGNNFFRSSIKVSFQGREITTAEVSQDGKFRFVLKKSIQIFTSC